MVLHFKNQEERIAYVMGRFEEIEPKVAEKEEVKAEISEEKPKKTAKKAKKSKKEDE